MTRTNNIGLGAGLRISMDQRQNKLEGDAPWTHVTFDINVEGAEREGELVGELRAIKGDAWFDLDSLRLRRVK